MKTQTAAAATEETDTPAETGEIAWVSDIAFEGVATSDGRYILPDALEWREPPLTLMAMTVTDDGHDGAYVAGRMDTFEKDSARDMDGQPLDEGVTAVRSRGIFDTGGESGAEVGRLVDQEIVRGVSVDLAILEWLFRDPDTGELLEPEDMNDDEWERAFFGELELAVRKAEILAATVCPTPAFEDARIAVTASGERVLRIWVPATFARVTTKAQPLTAAAEVAPLKPPREWFETSEPPGPMPLTITEDGRVFGHLADWETCHTGIADVCTTAPRSASGYAYFHTGELETAEGDCVAVGKLMLGGKHAPLTMSRASASQHYDDNTHVGAYVRAVDGEHGIWVAGALRHDLPEQEIRDFRVNPPSGDWRPVNGRLELVAGLAVPVPGFPVPRAEATLAASGGEIQVTALVISGSLFEPQPAVVRALAAAGALLEVPLTEDEYRDQVEVLAASAADDPVAALAELAAP